MSLVERCYLTAAFKRCSRDDKVIVSGHFSRCFKLSPNSSMLVSSLLRIGLYRENCQYRFQILQPPNSVRHRSPLYTMPELRNRDRSHLKLLIRLLCKPGPEVERTFLAVDDHIRIQDYCHLSLGAISRFREEKMSLCHSRASSGESSALSIASAKSRPLQTLLRSGMSLATAFPFFSSTNVVF